MLIPFTTTIFVGAALIFLVQPMIAKMVLPLYGGSPSVWNTCMVFFQAGLLFGYAYAHFGPRWFGTRVHAVVHAGLLLIPAVLLLLQILGVLPQSLLPITVTNAWAPAPGWPPAVWLLFMLLIGAGLPYFLVCATTPLLQRWLTASGHAEARDPYFLYAASNAGSLLALLSYPFLLELFFRLQLQSWIWTGGYVLLVVLIAICAALLWLAPASRGTFVLDNGEGTSSAREDEATRPLPPSAADTHVKKGKPKRKPDFSRQQKTTSSPAPLWQSRLRWVALAFVPSSLMLSVVTYVTTDLAPVPFLWVLSLAIYLVTFIITFARRPLLPHEPVRRFLPLVVLVLTIVILSEATEPVLMLLFLHLLGLFTVGLVCHGELARTRPEAERLTEFYLWLAAGGVLGGLFNALIAPLLFRYAGIIEYPLALVLASVLRQPITFDKKAGKPLKQILRRDVLPAALLFLFALALVFVAKTQALSSIATGPLRVGLVFGVPAIVCYTFLDRPLRYGLGIAALFLASIFYVGEYGKLIHIRRSFYGVYRLTLSDDGNSRKLIHGNTLHGQQSVLATDHDEPLTYYHRGSPIGRVIQRWMEKPDYAFLGKLVGVAGTIGGGFPAVWAIDAHKNEFVPPLKDIAVVGLGAGTLSAYAEPGQNWTYYEIDPTMVSIAETYFTYLKDAKRRMNGKGKLDIILGDARLKLAEEKSKKYDLLVIDAFNSDSVPLHLLTKNAMQIYLRRLKKRGVIAFHISNRYLNLKPVLEALADDAKLICYTRSDDIRYPRGSGLSASHWVLMGRAKSPIEYLIRPRLFWNSPEKIDKRYLWTDDFSNLLSVFKWKS